ncbi:hypothetical protein [uncultured Tateyamaria sp.]|uniref:hypothetical protein n=1 Tax=uncultured Tateyamaria sp. TaxID=455651 RepID=UPI00260C6F36|nr:hypothetical protein [uncultured Tateyamaria sp.]
MALNDQQRSFLEKFLKGGRFSKKSDAKKTAEYEEFLRVEALYMEVNKRVPAGTEGRDAVIASHTAANGLRDKGKFKEAHAAMDRVYADIQEVENRLMQSRNRMLQQCAALTLADDAQQSETDFFNAARLAANNALADERPTPDKLALGRAELDKAAKIAARSGALKDLHALNPGAAASAHLAFESMRAKTGGGDITPERIDAAEQALAEARLEVLRLDTELRRAEALPVGNLDAGIARMEQIVDARTAKEEADAKVKEAQELANALLGSKLLGEALESGPLSCKGAARKLPDAAIQTFIAGFEDHPRLAASAVDICYGALDPMAVANGFGTVTAQIDGGFKSADGKVPNGLEPEKFAEDILKMGGTCGADYFARLDDYVRLGGLMENAPLSEGADDNVSTRGLKRSVSAAAGLMDSNGVLALGSDAAKMSVGHMLFHPDAMAHPTPALNKHALDTIAMLGTDPTKGQAATVLAGVTPPPPGLAGSALVKASTGKVGNPSANDARQVILASMLQSVDQGPVGSCFATAPVRRLRQQDPIEAMRKYSELATAGTFTTVAGTVVPAVTNIPPGEDPLIRSLEYSLATAVGRDATMNLQVDMNIDTSNAAIDMEDALDGKLGGDAAAKTAAFLVAVRAEFTTVYDPLVLNGEVSSDGSSDRGRYVLVDSGGNQITTKKQYEEKAVEVALRATGYAADSKEGKAVVKAVKKDFMKELSTSDEPPWKLQDGDKSENTMVMLLPGTTGTRNKCTDKMASKPTSASDVGQRTEEILTALVDNLPVGAADSIPVDTKSMHDFSLMVGGDSMQDFLSGPGSTADKIRDKLLTPGQTLATTPLSVEDAQKAFDDVINPAVARLEAQSTDDSLSSSKRKKAAKKLKQLNENIAAQRPTVPVTPEELQDAVGYAVNKIFSFRAFEAKLQSKLVQDFSEPQIVLADTNWGDPESHTFFVIAPDPISGEPMIWQKEDPPGSMRQLGGDWLQASWGLLE